ncbi:MAG: hypothetical protein ACOVQM_22460, partial [Pirellula sp.]
MSLRSSFCASIHRVCNNVFTSSATWKGLGTLSVQAMILFLGCIQASAYAADPKVVSIWPKLAPGEPADAPAESEFTEGGTRFV